VHIKNYLIFGVVNFIAAALSGAAGGGGGLISTPVMIMLGLSPAQAAATAKFGGIGISLGASSRFFKEKIADTRMVLAFSIGGAVLSVLGSLLLIKIQDQTELIQKAMGVLILFIGIPALYLRSLGLSRVERPAWLKGLGAAVIAISIFIQVAFASGLGSVQTIVFIACFGMTALTASATKRAMQLTVASVALVIFIFSGLVDYRFGLAGLISSLLGGYLGAHIAVKKGNKFVINLFALTGAILALQLIIG
jgi:uncharacterized protein